jgi:tetratricopeptide (TPR) repeat protein
MGILLSALFVLLGPRPAACASADEYNKALQRVQNADSRLNSSFRLYQNAEEERARVNQALQWMRSDPASGSEDIASLRERYNAMKSLAEKKDAESKSFAREYIAAEEEYKKVAGSYYNEYQVGLWKERLSYAPTTEDQDALQRQNADPKKQPLERISSIGKDIASGKGGLGGILENTQMIGRLGDKLLDQDLQKGWGPEKAAPGAGPLAQGPGSRASPGQAPRSAAGIMNKAILISPRRADDAQRASPAARQTGAHLALQRAERAVAANPKDAAAWGMKAQALNRMRRFAEAEQAARRALALRPNDPKALKHLIWAQLHQKKYKEAQDNATALIRLTPNDPQAYVLRAFARENLDDRKGMLQDLEQAAELDPQRYSGHLSLAKSGARLFDPDDADSEALLEALALVPVRRGNPFIGIGVAVVFLALAGLLSTRRGGAAAAGPVALEAGTTPLAPIKTAPQKPVAPGTLLAKKYRMDCRIGEDHRGCFWQATDVMLSRPVLMRQASKEREGGAPRRFRTEAQALASLRHPHILEFYEFLDMPEGCFWVFERAPAKTLRQLLSRCGRFGLPQAKAVVGGVGHALSFAHSNGVTHRDLRPDCIHITESSIAKLGGFMPFDTQEPRPETRPYRAPETFSGAYLPASDVYSLAACLYEMLSGEPPKPKRPRLAGRVEGISPGVDALLDSAMEPDPEKRLADPLGLFNRL